MTDNTNQTTPTEGAQPAVKCDSCGTPRSTEPDYNPLTLLQDGSVGWYSGTDGELCPECMRKVLGRANA